MIGEARDGDEAILEIPRIKPDVVLLDLRMPGKSGLEVLEHLSRTGELPPTIILTTFDEDQLVLNGLRAGARGFLLKDVSLDQLVNAIKTVAEGGSLVQPGLTDRLLRGVIASGEQVRQPRRTRSADRARDRNPATDVGRLLEQGNRALAGCGRRHGQEPRFQHPVQAWRPGSHARGP